MIITLRGGITVCDKNPMPFVFILQILFLLENSGLVCFLCSFAFFFYICLRVSSLGFCSLQVFYFTVSLVIFDELKKGSFA